jgi:DNA mismatch endonuclease, patch repair protein
MRRTGRRDTAAEVAIRRELHRRGHRYRVDLRPSDRLRTRADIVFTRWRVAVFIDGCFWHGCPEHWTAPKANAAWWRQKIETNVARDRRTDTALTAQGWLVVRIWEHEDVRAAVARIEIALDDRRGDSTI